MYTLETSRRYIKDKGVPNFLDLISSENFPSYIRDELESTGILKNGIPQLSLIYQLAK